MVDDLIVDAAWRRRGIGKRLVHAIESWAHELDAAWVEMNVYDFNSEARDFYASMGYLPLSMKLHKPRSGR